MHFWQAVTCAKMKGGTIIPFARTPDFFFFFFPPMRKNELIHKQPARGTATWIYKLWRTIDKPREHGNGTCFYTKSGSLEETVIIKESIGGARRPSMEDSHWLNCCSLWLARLSSNEDKLDSSHSSWFSQMKQDVWSPVPLRQYKELRSQKSNEEVPFREAEINVPVSRHHSGGRKSGWGKEREVPGSEGAVWCDLISRGRNGGANRNSNRWALSNANMRESKQPWVNENSDLFNSSAIAGFFLWLSFIFYLPRNLHPRNVPNWFAFQNTGQGVQIFIFSAPVQFWDKLRTGS